jgi:hypothetical protein
MVLKLGCTYICVPLGGPIAQWRDESRVMIVRGLYGVAIPITPGNEMRDSNGDPSAFGLDRLSKVSGLALG